MTTTTLDPKHTQALVALLTHPTQQAAAASIGVSVDTLARWQKDPAFAAALRAARRDAIAQASGTFAASCSAAAETMLDIMTDPKASPSVRLRAATRILDYAYNSQQQDDLLARLDTLETALRDLQTAAGEQASSPAPRAAFPLRLDRLEADVTAFQLKWKAQQYATGETARRQAALDARWQDYLRVITPTLAPEHASLLEDAWPSIAATVTRVDEHLCHYDGPAGGEDPTPGQYLAMWFCDGYDDHRAGRPVSLAPEIAAAVLAAADEDPVQCRACRLRLPSPFTTCPHCGSPCIPWVYEDEEEDTEPVSATTG